jgi:hypothetical protein
MPVDWLTPQAHARLVHYLCGQYGDILYTRDDHAYPVAVRSITGDYVEVLLGDFAPRYISDFAIYDHHHLNTLAQSRSLTNGLCYALQSFDGDRLHGQLGYYFDMIATCDALDREIRAYADGRISHMSLREGLHQHVPSYQWVWGGAGRGSTIGLAALVVFYHDGAYRFIFCQRAHHMGVNAGLYHVLPAFVFQPQKAEWAKTEWSLTHQFLREFGEELFGMPEYPHWGHPDNPYYFYDEAPIADMRAMLADGRAQLLPTGAVFNLLSMRSELAMLCIIHDPNWYTRHEALLNQHLHVERHSTYYIPLDTLAGLPDDLHLKMTPQGAGVLWLGVDYARKVIHK